MLAADRQKEILNRIMERRSVQVDELAEELEVSSMTIRRDLEKLQKNGMIERCYGGAVAKKEVPYADKSISQRREKESIAKVCAGLVKEGESVFLDAGTTTYEIARKIQHIPDIMVATNDLEIARLLKESDVTLFLCGGQVQKSTGSMFGVYAMQMLRDFRFDVGFFGAASINRELEVLTPTIEKAFMKREAEKLCERSYLAVDDAKFEKLALNRINCLGDFTAVVTNHSFTEEEKEKIKEMDGRIIAVGAV